MKTLYFDCFSGISGDMAIASLLDLGVSRKLLETELHKLKLSKEYHLHYSRAKRQEITGLKFDVHAHTRHPHDGRLHTHHGHHHSHPHLPSNADQGRSFREIRRLIERSSLSSFVRQKAIRTFHRIALAEGKIHGVPVEKVHFHEVGGIDSIVDIVGACVLLEELAPEQILASIPCEGQGFVDCAHGHFPIPTAATVELLKGVPLRQIEIQGELITPTGAALLAEFVGHFGPISTMSIEKIGYGLGTRSYPNHPNVLRTFLGNAPRFGNSTDMEAIDVLETNVDDVTPEILAVAMERLLSEGARDVFLTPVIMKKGRPATLVTVLANPKESGRLARILLSETGSFGLRLRRAERICLERETQKAKLSMGDIEIKIGRLQNEILSAKPELESCKKLAKQIGRPVRIVWTEAISECSRLLRSTASRKSVRK